jgi:hypothetical protein
MGNRRTLNTEQNTTMSHATMVQLASILDRRTLNTEQGDFVSGVANFISGQIGKCGNKLISLVSPRN